MPQKLTKKAFIERAIKTHGNKYDYSKVDYQGKDTKVCIICPEHGEFWQTPNNHWKGKGCYECSRSKMGNKKYNTETFIKKSIEIHGNIYDYSKVVYKDLITKVPIICPEHGEFMQLPSLHLNGSECPICSHNNKHNLNNKRIVEIYDYIKSLEPNIIIEQHNRDILDGKELDIYIPSLKVAIEYNGLYWHNSFIVDRNYHYNKLLLCKEKGIKLLQIFEDEYVNNKEIVLSKIKHILKVSENLPKVMGRKCIIKEIDKFKAKAFLNANHIQGYVGATIYLGAFYNDILVGVMSFKQDRNKNIWELTRCATDIHYNSQGVAGKLFKYFVRKYNPQEIKSFADRRWTINEDKNLYTNLGFNFESYTPIDYHYYHPKDGCIRQHKFSFRKDKLHKKYGLPLTMTESEMTKQLGYTRIWDCGLIKYVWHNE